MESAQSSFISSLMWTERTGFAAGIATLTKMKKYKVQNKTTFYGKKIKELWKKIASETQLDIEIKGMDSIPEFNLNYPNRLELLTLFNQEMLKRGFLSNSRLATTYAYSDNIIEQYAGACLEAFQIISKFLNKKGNISLKGPVKHDTFKRLN